MRIQVLILYLGGSSSGGSDGEKLEEIRKGNMKKQYVMCYCAGYHFALKHTDIYSRFMYLENRISPEGLQEYIGIIYRCTGNSLAPS